MSFNYKRILVTGGAGAIGSNLVNYLINQESVEKIIILDNFISGDTLNIQNSSKIILVKGEIVNEIDLKRVFNYKPQIVYHLAAFFANQNSVDYPEKDLNVNILGTLRLLEYSNLSNNVEKFIYASSGCSIYGSESPLPLKEDYFSMFLSSPYQISKMTGELYCNFYLKHYGLKIIKARFFNSYGAGELPGQYRNVIPNFIYWGLNKKPLPLTGDSEMTRDFTFVGDIVQGLSKCATVEKAVGEEFNLASGREIKIADLANLINKYTNNPSGTKSIGRRKWDTKKRILASISKSEKILGYKPNKDFEKGLLETIDWFRNNFDYIKKKASFSIGTSSALETDKK